MRTIKFRAKNLDGEWVYGFYVEEERQTLNGFEKKYFIVNDGYDYVKPDTVGQFTGLYDKDGREIYEGDIIISEELKHTCHYVRYMESEAMFVAMIIGSPLDEYCGIRQSWIDKFSKKIIGNIHDNPELLKGGNHGSK